MPCCPIPTAALGPLELQATWQMQRCISAQPNAREFNAQQAVSFKTCDEQLSSEKVGNLV